jgi:hypothetical protein
VVEEVAFFLLIAQVDQRFFRTVTYMHLSASLV